MKTSKICFLSDHSEVQKEWVGAGWNTLVGYNLERAGAATLKTQESTDSSRPYEDEKAVWRMSSLLLQGC